MDPQLILPPLSWLGRRTASGRTHRTRWKAVARPSTAPPAAPRWIGAADGRVMAANGFTAGVLSGVELLQDRWGQLVPPDDPLWAWPVFAAAERARTRADQHGYAVVRRAGEVVAVLPLSGFRELRLPEALGVAVPEWLSPPLSVLLCGSPLGTGRVLSAGPLSEPIADLLVRAVLEHARRRGSDLVVFKDFAEPDLAPLRSALRRSRFFFAPAPPDVEFRLGEFRLGRPAPPGRPALPGTRVEVLDDFGHLLPEVLTLHRAVAGAPNVLDEEFLRALRPVGGLRRRLVACFRDDRLVAYLLCLFTGFGATGVHVGLDDGVVREAGLHRVAADLAAAEGCERIRFPRGSGDLGTGGELVEQSFAITHLRPLPRAVLRGLLPRALAEALRR